jgi:hypothetical protein
MPISPVDSVPLTSLTTSEAAAMREILNGQARRREERWRTRHVSRRGVITLLVLAILANLLWIVGLDGVMQPHRLGDETRAIRVTLIEPISEYEIPPEPVPQPAVFKQKPTAIRIAPPETKLESPPIKTVSGSQTEARIGVAGDTTPQLFRADGSLRMPDVKTRIGPDRIENPQEAAKARWAEIQARGDNPLDCTRTRFAGAFKPDQSAGDRVAGKYLSWIGLADMRGIAERAAERERRAAEGCDPPADRP